MQDNGIQWNSELVRTTFPASLAKAILSTPILDMDHDRILWCPSSTGTFTVKCTHKLITTVSSTDSIQQRQSQLWKLIWHSNLHVRHKVLLWRWNAGIIPTLDKLQSIIPIQDSSCYICGTATESPHHLALECPLTLMIWWNLPWQLRLEPFKNLGLQEWTSLILGRDNPFPIPSSQKS